LIDTSTIFAAGPPLRVALIGNYPPRRCGIATYTRDVATALRQAGHRVHITAMCDPGSDYDFVRAVDIAVRQESRADHVSAGRAIAEWRPDAVLVEHEFGIFGGPAGIWLLDLLNAAAVPAVIRLHTILARPTPEQAEVIAGLRSRAQRLIAMARRGAAILGEDGSAASPPVEVIPHGVPDRSLVSPSSMRARLGWPERPTLLTFGLISPGKGIEMVIEALPRILGQVPTARYVLLGATHPALVAREGERYREGLAARAEALGVSHALRMENRYVADDALCDALQATDIYVTPYLGEAQITSGTLAYALACGVPTLSTPYWHAQEVLPPEFLVPFGDAVGLADKAAALLSAPELRKTTARTLWNAHREAVWPTHAKRLANVLRAAALEGTPRFIAAE
jgi:glycosyltransferase involved in cell wall biosynthesis